MTKYETNKKQPIALDVYNFRVVNVQDLPQWLGFFRARMYRKVERIQSRAMFTSDMVWRTISAFKCSTKFVCKLKIVILLYSSHTQITHTSTSLYHVFMECKNSSKTEQNVFQIVYTCSLCCLRHLRNVCICPLSEPGS